MKRISQKIIPLIVILVLISLTESCTTGWVKKDKKTNTGIYVWDDGTYYQGGYINKIKSGKGTLVYGFNRYKKGAYTYYSDNPPGFINCSLTGEYENNSLKNDSHLIFNCGKTNDGKSDSFTYEGNYANGGFEGKGIVRFNDGRVLEGNFSNEKTLYSWTYCCVYYNQKAVWQNSNLLGSKISGFCKMTWPNGSVFEGNIYDYYLFDRGNVYSYSTFKPSLFRGVGVLKVPGSKLYKGLVGESFDRRTVSPIKEEVLLTYIKNLKSFTFDIQNARNKSDGFESKAENEGILAQKEASDWLKNEMANLPNKLNTQLAESDAGSRGTTIAAEKEETRKLAEFNKIIAQNSNINSSSSKSSSVNSSNKKSSSSSNSSLILTTQQKTNNTPEISDEARAEEYFHDLNINNYEHNLIGGLSYKEEVMGNFIISTSDKGSMEYFGYDENKIRTKMSEFKGEVLKYYSKSTVYFDSCECEQLTKARFTSGKINKNFKCTMKYTVVSKRPVVRGNNNTRSK
nr:hypothetical protein [uncultured Flavobacterium sp.]